MKINWNQDMEQEARIEVTDGVYTSYVSEGQLPAKFSLYDIALAYAKMYDHNGNDGSHTVAEIEDMDDGEIHHFAFDGHGRFDWDTRRQFIV